MTTKTTTDAIRKMGFVQQARLVRQALRDPSTPALDRGVILYLRRRSRLRAARRVTVAIGVMGIAAVAWMALR
jgi:hypothetical protein